MRNKEIFDVEMEKTVEERREINEAKMKEKKQDGKEYFPIVLQANKSSINLNIPKDRQKKMVAGNLTIGHLTTHIRSFINKDMMHICAIYLFTNTHKNLSLQTTVKEAWERFHDDDFYLKIVVSEEACMG